MEQIEAKHIKKGNYYVIKKRPCKVIDYEIAKPGKHGHVKVSLTGIDVLNSNKIMHIYAGHEKIYEFKLERISYQMINMDGNLLYYLKDNSEQAIKVNTESTLYEDIKSKFEDDNNILVTVIRAPIEKEDGIFEYDELVENFKIDL